MQLIDYKKNIIPIISLLIVILQNPIWPFWFTGKIVSFMLIILLFFIFVIKKRIKFLKNQFFLYSLSLILLIIIPLFNGAFHISSICTIICLMLIYGMEINEKLYVLDKLTSYLCIVISISLPAWLIHQYVFPLPLYSLIDFSSFKGVDNVMMENYILFVQCQGIDALRFYSMFDEPGVLGTLSAFVLYGNNYNLKDKRVLIILLGAFFTFSLAFILLSLIGILWQCRKSLKALLSYIFIISTVVYMLFFFILAENEAFQQAVVYRITNLSDSDTLSRNGFSFDYYYDKLVNSPLVLIGYGGRVQNFIVDGASYKNFIFEYGILGIVGLVLAYISMIKLKNSDSIGCLLIFSFSFLQRPVAFSAWQILLFACILSAFIAKSMERNTEKGELPQVII